MHGPTVEAARGAKRRVNHASLCLTAAIFVLAGCQPPAQTSPAAEPGVREYWDACFFDDVKVGHIHTQYRPIDEQGKSAVEIVATVELNLQRFGDSVTQKMENRSVETPDGEVLRLESKMQNQSSDAPAMTMATTGRVQGNQLNLDISTLGKTVTTEVPWDKTIGGFFAMEQNLERQPMRAGEKRTFRSLTPGFNQIAEVEYEAIGPESTKLIDGTRELLRIKTKIKLGKNTLEQTVWTDSAGQTIKTYMPAMQQTTYRTTREIALSKSEGFFDLGERTIVAVSQKLDKPHQTRRAHYRITFTSGDPAKNFSPGATQIIRQVDEHTIDLLVRSLRPTDELGAEFPADQPPTEDDRAANALIQSDDPAVVAMADKIAPGKSAFWEVAVELERYVRQHVATKNFSQALASAADVARSGEGDCTEHAVLLAALCRAKQIPARVAIGLVYFPSARGFAYHMWTEAWNQDRWIPLDATLGLGGIGAAHLRVSSSSLKGADPFGQFLPVFQLIGNIQVQVISAE
jgi:transglutaminase-like putative cysteine protease